MGMTIPSHCWKVILFLPKDKDDLSRVKENTRVIAVDFPNDGSTAKQDWAKYRTSVSNIESKTGLNFFKTLPTNVSNSLKSLTDNVVIPKEPKPKKRRLKKKPK